MIIKDWCGCEWTFNEFSMEREEWMKVCDKVKEHKALWNISKMYRKKHTITTFQTPYGAI